MLRLVSVDLGAVIRNGVQEQELRDMLRSSWEAGEAAAFPSRALLLLDLLAIDETPVSSNEEAAGCPA